MTMEHDHARRSQSRTNGTDDGHDAPGRRSGTEGMTSGAGPQPSGLVMRKATRDDNRVAAGADAAVASASTSSGAPLPSGIRQQFETSLGVDLGGVRVHTGATSAAAAHAVGARAYAVGQDIHFGAGNYDPRSSAGQHLLAHEVAHTVQQRGAAPTRQNKLEVSRKTDHAEVEADAAADAMVAGRSFAVSQAPVAIARDEVIELDEDQVPGQKDADLADADKMAKAGDAAEARAQQVAKETGSKSALGTVGQMTVDNKADADRVAAMIAAEASKLDQGISAGDIDANTRQVNADAINQLRGYSETLDGDALGSANFQSQAQVLGADFARLRAEMQALDKSGQGGGQIKDATDHANPGSSRGGAAGQAVLDVSGGGSAAELNKGFKETITAKEGDPRNSPNATTHWKNVQDADKAMRDAMKAVTTAQRDLHPKQLAAEAAGASLRAAAASATVAEFQSDIDTLRSKAAAAEEKIKLVGGTVKNAASIAFGAVDKNGPKVDAIVGAAISIVTDLTAYAAKHWDDTGIEDKGKAQAVAKANQLFESTKAAALKAQQAMTEYGNAAKGVYENLDALAVAKRKYRESMKLMGQSLDKAQGGNAYSIVAEILGDAETYLVQSELTIAMGKSAIGKMPAGQPGQVVTHDGSVTYFLAVQPPDKHTYFASRASFRMKGSLATKGPLRNTIEKTVELMEQERVEIEALANKLRGTFKP
jgi:hypothetical protein